MYIAGGSRTGRYLPDVQVYDIAGCVLVVYRRGLCVYLILDWMFLQVFDFRGLMWSSLKFKSKVDGGKGEENGAPEVLPATSDHSMVRHWIH